MTPLTALPAQAYPLPIARALHALVGEVHARGLCATADATVAIIEAVFEHVGRLWVAEYLRAGAFDATINSQLLPLASGDPPRLGAWVALGRALSAAFASAGLPTTCGDLTALDLSSPTDPLHPVTRLVGYRNSFAHGTMRGVADDILAHQAILADMLERFACLRASAAPGAGPDLRDLLEHPAFRRWRERHAMQLRGHLDFSDRFSLARSPPADVVVELDLALAAGVSLVVIEAHPGCGQTTLAAWLARAHAAPVGEPTLGLNVFVVEPGAPSHSAHVFASWLARRTERALGLPDESLGTGPSALSQAIAALRHHGARLPVVLQDAHHGEDPARGETLGVLDVFRSLAGSPIVAFATLPPGSTRRRVRYDRRVSWPVPPAEAVNLAAVEAYLHEATRGPGRALHRRVLRALAEDGGALDLFGLCDEVERAGGGAVFEPAVERAIWDLRPLLRVTRGARGKEAVRYHALFSSAIAPLVRALAEPR